MAEEKKLGDQTEEDIQQAEGIINDTTNAVQDVLDLADRLSDKKDYKPSDSDKPSSDKEQTEPSSLQTQQGSADDITNGNFDNAYTGQIPGLAEDEAQKAALNAYDNTAGAGEGSPLSDEDMLNNAFGKDHPDNAEPVNANLTPSDKNDEDFARNQAKDRNMSGAENMRDAKSSNATGSGNESSGKESANTAQEGVSSAGEAGDSAKEGADQAKEAAKQAGDSAKDMASAAADSASTAASTAAAPLTMGATAAVDAAAKTAKKIAKKAREEAEKSKKKANGDENKITPLKIFCVLLAFILGTNLLFGQMVASMPLIAFNAIGHWIEEQDEKIDEEAEKGYEAADNLDKDGHHIRAFFARSWTFIKKWTSKAAILIPELIYKAYTAITNFFNGASQETQDAYKDTKDYEDSINAQIEVIQNLYTERYESLENNVKLLSSGPHMDQSKSMESFYDQGKTSPTEEAILNVISSYSVVDSDHQKATAGNLEKVLKKHKSNFLINNYTIEPTGEYDEEEQEEDGKKKKIKIPRLYIKSNLTCPLETEGKTDESKIMDPQNWYDKYHEENGKYVKDKGATLILSVTDVWEAVGEDTDKFPYAWYEIKNSSASGDAEDPTVEVVSNQKQMDNYKRGLKERFDEWGLSDDSFDNGGDDMGFGAGILSEKQINEWIKVAEDTAKKRGKKLSGNRKWLIKNALCSVGMIPYRFGDGHGSSPKLKRGYNDWWWKPAKTRVVMEGVNKMYKYRGLDCSSFCYWLYATALNPYNGSVKVGSSQSGPLTKTHVSASEVMPGDFSNNSHHILMFLGEKGGVKYYVHCNSSLGKDGIGASKKKSPDTGTQISKYSTATGWYKNPYSDIEGNSLWKKGKWPDWYSGGYDGGAFMTRDTQNIEWLKNYAGAATLAAKYIGNEKLAPYIYAQWLFETGASKTQRWLHEGQSGEPIAPKHNNLGGVRCSTCKEKYGACGNFSDLNKKYAVYPSLKKYAFCYANHVRAFSKKYKYRKEMQKAKTLDQFLVIIGESGYHEAGDNVYNQSVRGKLLAYTTVKN